MKKIILLVLCSLVHEIDLKGMQRLFNDGSDPIAIDALLIKTGLKKNSIIDCLKFSDDSQYLFAFVNLHEKSPKALKLNLTGCYEDLNTQDLLIRLESKQAVKENDAGKILLMQPKTNHTVTIEKRFYMIESIVNIEFSPNGNLLVIGTDHNMLEIRDLLHQQRSIYSINCTNKHDRHFQPSICDFSQGNVKVAFSPNGKYLAAATSCHTNIWLFEIAPHYYRYDECMAPKGRPNIFFKFSYIK